MGAFHGLGFVCALGAVEGLRGAGVDIAALGWPQDVVDRRTSHALATLDVHAGYDKGMFARCAVLSGPQVALLRGLADDELAGALERGIASRVAAWKGQVVSGGAQAGPLAPVLSDYFDLVALLGRPVVAVYPNGNVMARGTFAGVDVWGRATLVTGDGRELGLAPEQVSIRPA